MGQKEEKNVYSKLLRDNTFCVLATASKKGEPEAATIDFVADEENTIYFVTSQSYKKYKNLKENPYGSIVITDAPDTLQLQGEVSEVKGNEERIAINMLTSKLGQSPQMYPKEGWKFFKFVIKDMQITTYPKIPSRYKKPTREIQ